MVDPGWFEQQLYGPPNNNAMENAISIIIMVVAIQCNKMSG